MIVTNGYKTPPPQQLKVLDEASQALNVWGCYTLGASLRLPSLFVQKGKKLGGYFGGGKNFGANHTKEMFKKKEFSEESLLSTSWD